MDSRSIVLMSIGNKLLECFGPGSEFRVELGPDSSETEQIWLAKWPDESLDFVDESITSPSSAFVDGVVFVEYKAGLVGDEMDPPRLDIVVGAVRTAVLFDCPGREEIRMDGGSGGLLVLL